MYGTKQTDLKNYDDDISETLWSKGEKDVENWMRSTLNMALRLRNHPDPTKPDPAYLITKLTRRAEQMEKHLALRKTIVKNSPLSVAMSSNALESMMQQARGIQTMKQAGIPGSSETSLTPQDEIWQLAAPPLRTPPPHMKKESDHLTIDERIEREGEIDVDKEKFVINENGI